MTTAIALFEPTDNHSVVHRSVEPEPGHPATQLWLLIERAQAGEAEAFGAIYEHYYELIFRYIRFRVADRQTAEDLTADTFLRAFKRIGAFTWQGRDPGAWLVTIARHLVADHFKSGRHRFESVGINVLNEEDTRPDERAEGRPEQSVVDHLTHLDMLRAVQQLTREQHECIVLRFLRGLSVAETARVMGKNQGAIKALQYRARNELVRLLATGATSAPPTGYRNDGPAEGPHRPVPDRRARARNRRR